MSRFDSSTGTLLYLPEAACLAGADDVLRPLAAANVRIETSEFHNPMAWLDDGHTGTFLRLLPFNPSAPERLSWGGINWDDESQTQAVLEVAESLALRTRNRWYALCQYQGWDEECTAVTEAASLEEFRELLRETERPRRRGRHRDTPPPKRHPKECRVYKVRGPTWAQPHSSADT